MIKIKVLSQSGLVVDGLVNPQPVVISDPNNIGITDDNVTSNQMSDNFFAFNDSIELPEKSLTREVAMKLMSDEMFGNIARDGAEYPAGSYKVPPKYQKPEQNARNNQYISEFWLGLIENAPKSSEEKVEQEQEKSKK